MRSYEISKNENVITFVGDHGECYGGERTTRILTEGKTGRKLYMHIKKYAGEAFAKAAKVQGFC